MEAFIGTILPWAGNYVPQGWLACDGATYSFMQQSQFQALYAVIGNTYGGSSAAQTFAVPDLRGRVPMGAGNALRPGTVTTLSVGTGTDQLPALAVNYIICYNGLFPMRDD